jgi:hypothetical protein
MCKYVVRAWKYALKSADLCVEMPETTSSEIKIMNENCIALNSMGYGVRKLIKRE